MASIRPILLLLPLAAGAACSDSTNLADATSENFVDTVTVGSLTDTPVTTASGFSVTSGAVRTDQTGEFDFAFDIEGDAATGRPVLLPRAALGLVSTTTADPGLQRRDENFDQIDLAPSNGYTTDEKVTVAVGDRFVVRSRVVCSALGVPLYAKIEVLRFETGSIVLKVLSDVNCGYRGLEPGFPDR